MRRIVSAVLATGLASSPFLLATPAFAGTIPTTGSICGYAWNDVNGDGLRQSGEPSIQTSMGIAGGDKYDTATDQNGHYCITGLPFGRYRVQFNDLAGYGYGWTRPGKDSLPDWHTGTSGPVEVGIGGAPAEVDNFDVGYLKGEDDDHPVVLALDLPKHPLRVGDTVRITAVTEVSGNLPDAPRTDVTLPDGLKATGTFGTMTASLSLTDHEVAAGPYGRMDPFTEQALGIIAVVTQPMHNAQLHMHVYQSGYADTNPNDQDLYNTISAVAAPPTTTTPPATTTTQPAGAVPTTTSAPGTGVRTAASTTSLPNTGVSVIEPLLAGITLVLVGVAGFWLARRRRRAG